MFPLHIPNERQWQPHPPSPPSSPSSSLQSHTLLPSSLASHSRSYVPSIRTRTTTRRRSCPPWRTRPTRMRTRSSSGRRTTCRWWWKRTSRRRGCSTASGERSWEPESFRSARGDGSSRTSRRRRSASPAKLPSVKAEAGSFLLSFSASNFFRVNYPFNTEKSESV